MYFLSAFFFGFFFVISLTKGWVNPCFSKEKTACLKAVLPFFIIAVHSQFIDSPSTVGSCVVAAFFFISGYGLEFKKKSLGLFGFGKHVIDLLVPAFIPIVVYVLVEIFFLKMDANDIFERNICQYRIILPYTWFILNFIILHALFYLTVNFVRKTFFRLAVLLILLVVMDVLLISLHAPDYTVRANIAFWMGVILCEIMPYISSNYKTRTFCSIFLFVGLSILLPHCNMVLKTIIIPFWTFSLFYCLLGIPISSNKVISFFSSISYEIYLCQGIAFLLVPKLPPYQHFVFISVLTVMIAFSCRTIIQYIMGEKK